MRIAVNTRLIIPDALYGIGWFAYQTLSRIAEKHPEHEFLFIFDRKVPASLKFSDNVKCINVFPPARHPFLWFVFFEYSIPYMLNKKKYKSDIFVSPDGWIPLCLDIPALTVIHDINFEHNPEFIGSSMAKKYYWHFFRKFAHKADRIVTVSEFCKKDIAQTYNINPEKIDIAYNGANAKHKKCSPAEIKEIRLKYTQGEEYFVFVGSMHKRKNIIGVLKAFDKFKMELEKDPTNKKKSNVKLLLIGNRPWKDKELDSTINSLVYKDDIIFINRFVEAEEIGKILSASIASLYPSFFEGFGVPIIEAFEAETPIITSNTSSMPEVGGQAAYYVDPYKYEEICEGMLKIYGDPNFRQQLIEAGIERKKVFSWERSADLLWEAIEKLINQRGIVG